MKKAICIFVSRNEKPDLYVNILSFCIAKFGKDIVERAYLLKIIDHPVERKKESKKLKDLKQNITSQINALVEGKYLNWDWKSNKFADIKESVKIDIEEDRKYLYESFQEVLNKEGLDTLTILNDEIESQLLNIIKADDVDFIFDVTGVITRHLIKVSLVLLANQKGIFAFEMHKRLAHNQEDLIHNLDSKDYDYIRLNVQDYDVANKNISKRKNQLHTKDTSIKIRKESWLDEIAKGNSDKVIEEILNYSKNQDNDIREIINLSSRYRNINRLMIKGTIQTEDYGTELNKINDSLMGIISMI
jgi:hypothetical protein